MAKQVSPGVLALRKVVDDVYADAREAKKQGKLVGWSSSKFPCELAEAFDLNVMYPENQAAGIAAQRDGEIMCQAAEDLGFDNDICGYARISLAYAAGKRASRKFDPETLEFIIDPNSGKPLKDENGKVVIDPETGKPKKDPKTQVPYTVLDDIHEIEALPETTEKEIAYKNFRREAIKPYKQMRIPQPDFVLCCNNICNCMTKWYENIARMCNIPLIMVDIPYNNTVEVSDSAVKYVRAQFDNAIHELEKLTGKKFDEKKFELACKHANRTAQNWLKVCDFLQYKPAPMSGFDLFNHMADVVTARGKEAAADAFELLSKDLHQGRHLHAALPREVPRHVRGHPLLAEAPEPVQAPQGERHQRHRSCVRARVRLCLQQHGRNGPRLLQGSELRLHRAGRCLARGHLPRQ